MASNLVQRDYPAARAAPPKRRLPLTRKPASEPLPARIVVSDSERRRHEALLAKLEPASPAADDAGARAFLERMLADGRDAYRLGRDNDG